MPWIVVETWHDGHVAEFGEFTSRAAAEEFAAHAQMPNASDAVEKVEVVEVE